MAVKVQINHNQSATHEAGVRTFVHDGHLFVAKGPSDGDVIAIYAPGHWQSVERS